MPSPLPSFCLTPSNDVQYAPFATPLPVVNFNTPGLDEPPSELLSDEEEVSSSNSSSSSNFSGSSTTSSSNHRRRHGGCQAQARRASKHKKKRTTVKILRELIQAGSYYNLPQLALHQHRNHRCTAFLHFSEGLKTITRTVTELSNVLTNYPTISAIKNWRASSALFCFLEAKSDQTLRAALSHLYQSTNLEDGIGDALALLVKLCAAQDQEEQHESMQAVHNLNIKPGEHIVKFNQRFESYIKRVRNAGVILSDDDGGKNEDSANNHIDDEDGDDDDDGNCDLSEAEREHLTQQCTQEVVTFDEMFSDWCTQGDGDDADSD